VAVFPFLLNIHLLCFFYDIHDNIDLVWYHRCSGIFYSGCVVYSYWMQGGKNAENSRRKIFVGGLPSSVTEKQLKEYFSRYGHVCSGLCLLPLNFSGFCP